MMSGHDKKKISADKKKKATWGKKIVLLCLLILNVPFFLGMTFTPSQKEFSLAKLHLGDSKAMMEQRLGKKYIYAREENVYGHKVRFYHYDTVIIGLNGDNKVVDISTDSRDYAANDNVRVGATPYRINQVFGEAPRQMWHDGIYLLYREKKNSAYKLLLRLKPLYSDLEYIRLTALPVELPEQEIDKSALPHTVLPELQFSFAQN